MAEGRGDELPETVLAILQARIGRLDPAARRVLRAASIFGNTFSPKGLRALLGPDTHTTAIAASLDLLISAEMLESAKGPSGRGEDERNFDFRHGLLREAAYGLLTDSDRRTGHRLAASFLEVDAPHDPQTIATHYERAGEIELALEFFMTAAELSFYRNALQMVELSCVHIEALRPSGAILGRLYVLRSQLAFNIGDMAAAYQGSKAALPLLLPGSEPWYRAAAIHLLTSGARGKVDDIAGIIAQFAAVTPAPEAHAVFVFASAIVSILFSCLGMPAAAAGTLQRAESMMAELLENLPYAECWYFRALAVMHRFFGTDLSLTRKHLARAARAAEKMAHRRHIITNRAELWMYEAVLGNLTDAETNLRQLHRQAQELGEPYAIQSTTASFVNMLVFSGNPEQLEEARRLAVPILPQVTENLLVRGTLQSALGHLQVLLGEHQQGLAALRQITEIVKVVAGLRPFSLGSLLQALLHIDEVAEANLIADEAEALLSRLEPAGIYEPILRLYIAEARERAGEHARAVPMLRTAHTLLHSYAATLPDDEARTRYLSGNRHHVRILSRAKEWLG